MVSVKTLGTGHYSYGEGGGLQKGRGGGGMWSFTPTKKGGCYKRGGGHVEFYPYEKGGGGVKSFSHAEGGGGHKKLRGSFSHIVWGGGAKSFRSSKGEGEARKVLPCLEGAAQKVSDQQFSHFVAPPLPVINDQSFRPWACLFRPTLRRSVGRMQSVGRRR